MAVSARCSTVEGRDFKAPAPGHGLPSQKHRALLVSCSTGLRSHLSAPALLVSCSAAQISPICPNPGCLLLGWSEISPICPNPGCLLLGWSEISPICPNPGCLLLGWSEISPICPNPGCLLLGWPEISPICPNPGCLLLGWPEISPICPNPGCLLLGWPEISPICPNPGCLLLGWSEISPICPNPGCLLLGWPEISPICPRPVQCFPDSATLLWERRQVQGSGSPAVSRGSGAWFLSSHWAAGTTFMLVNVSPPVPLKQAHATWVLDQLFPSWCPLAAAPDVSGAGVCECHYLSGSASYSSKDLGHAFARAPAALRPPERRGTWANPGQPNESWMQRLQSETSGDCTVLLCDPGRDLKRLDKALHQLGAQK
ncbi:hypothetical protein P4O66_002530 [Electrophorus voltai]|uniref:Uncharacterized protein n=1 Tax=Electrophorus voltai TaxID=2609070 RepID=A0AAD8YX69_9TELE|nr:hypothetical protein P4O66_002530 [Electrophorus voltai]